jgi:hypothetical protein
MGDEGRFEPRPQSSQVKAFPLSLVLRIKIRDVDMDFANGLFLGRRQKEVLIERIG